MNESSKKQNHLWLRRAFLVWLVFFIANAGLLASFDLDAYRRGNHMPPFWQQCLMSAAGATLALGLWYFIRWPFTSWRNFRRMLVSLAIFATLVAVFYAEEDWRGKRAWENCKRELEAKGAVLDWNAYIPPPVPDDQNFFTASTNILLRFVKQDDPVRADAAAHLQWLRLINYFNNESNAFPILDFAKSNQPVVAEISFAAAKYDSTINLDDPAARDKIQNLVRTTIGRSINGVQGFLFSELPLDHLSPAKIELQSSGPVSIGDLENFIPSDLVTNIGKLAIEATVDPKIFQAKFVSGRITAAADYLKWSDQFAPAFDEVREALKRPYAIIPGDYSRAYAMPIPNFVTMRAFVQTLAQRAQCDFLLGKPDDALRELTLIHDVCRILEKPPTGKPETLVEAMINVAISGLYVSTIADGFKLNAWGESQMTALQKQLEEIKLAPYVVAAFEAEQAGSSHTLETTPASKIGELFNMSVFTSGKNNRPIWKKITNPMYLYFKFCPRGWIYQNMVNSVSLVELAYANGVDLKQETISPSSFDEAIRDLTKFLNRRTPFNFWAQIAVPNFTKGWQTTAYNQTLVNEAQIACALERYHLANGNYPETLDALAPQFIAQIPHDLIGGQPLHYRRTDDGKFLLYSVGWNETDDGGSPGTLMDVKKGDWVWP